MSPSSLQAPVSGPPCCNVADRLAHFASQVPSAVAVACPGQGPDAICNFAELDADATTLARALVDRGVRPGMRLVLLVPPGVEFVKLVFALLRSGATTVLIDPGMGRRHLLDCLASTMPDGFIAVSRAQALRTLLRRRFPTAKLNVTLGPRWFWRGPTYHQLLAQKPPFSRDPKSAQGDASPTHSPVPTNPALPHTNPDDPAAIIFTSGSTGPPKGVLYTHRMFDAQAAEIQREYDIQPGGVDLACFALFGLFNSAMGVTTVFPDMDFSRPAAADPRKLLAAANQWRVTQAFASPAVWDKLSRHGAETGERIPTLQKVFSCGAPVHADVLRRTLKHVAAPGALMHTPYGATEALPVSTIEAREVLSETAALTSKGAGVCVGRKFASIEWRVIQITDKPIASIAAAEELPRGEIGELIVRGPQVSPSYTIVPHRTGRLSDQSAAPSASPHLSSPPNAQSKIPDGATIWHRMGDVGCLDAQGRFWYYGRKSQRVETGRESLFTESVEAAFNQHPAVRRCALVSLGPADGPTPVIVVESNLPILKDRRQGMLSTEGVQAWNDLILQLKQLAAPSPKSSMIDKFLLIPELPVDVRHNAKINREELAHWAATQQATDDLRHLGDDIDDQPPSPKRPPSC